MKNKILLSIIAGIFLVLLINSASAELWGWSQTIFPTKNIVRYHLYYQIEDTSSDLITIQKPVPIQLLANVQNLPYNISTYYPQYPNALVDWCNYTITWQRNIYDNSFFGDRKFNIINTTLETANTFYQNTNATFNISIYNLKAKDGLLADMDCHYTNNDTLFIENTYFGFITGYIPSFECSGCNDHTFEELTNLNEQILSNNFQEVGIFNQVQNVVEKNFQVWIILFWIIKISLILTAVLLMFVAIYYFYLFFKSISDGIR